VPSSEELPCDLFQGHVRVKGREAVCNNQHVLWNPTQQCLCFIAAGHVVSGGMDSKLWLWPGAGVRGVELQGHAGPISQVCSQAMRCDCLPPAARSRSLWSGLLTNSCLLLDLHLWRLIANPGALRTGQAPAAPHPPKAQHLLLTAVHAFCPQAPQLPRSCSKPG